PPSATSLSFSQPQPRSPACMGAGAGCGGVRAPGRRAGGGCFAHARKAAATRTTPIAPSTFALTLERGLGFDPSMRTALTAALLVSTLSLLLLPAAQAASRDFPTVAARAPRCRRVAPTPPARGGGHPRPSPGRTAPGEGRGVHGRARPAVGEKRDDYRAGNPALEGRVLFTDASPGHPDAAFVKENDPLVDPARISSRVEAGYIVRTRADADTVQARTGETAQRQAALGSGRPYAAPTY